MHVISGTIDFYLLTLRTIHIGEFHFDLSNILTLLFVLNMTSVYFYNTGPVYLCLFVLPCWTTRWRYLILRELIEGVIRLRCVMEAAVFDPVFASICGWAQLFAE